MKKTKKLWIISGIIAGLIVIALALYFIYPKLTGGDQFIKITLVDADGNTETLSTIDSHGEPLSIIQGRPGKVGMYLTITATNTGAVPLTCSIVSATPTAFDTAIDKASKYIPSTAPKKASWTSSLISLSQFEGLPQPVNFQVTMRCSYMQGTNIIYVPDKIGNVPLTILPDIAGADFTVGIDTGGLDTEYCGDSICQASESSTSCPVDCTVFVNVKFRTSDISYASGSAIAFTTTCGSNLTQLGYSSSGGTSATTRMCSGQMSTQEGYTLLLSNLPGGWNTGYNAPSLWQKGTSYKVCQDTNGTASVYYKIYSASDPDASKVDSSPITIDLAREVIC